MPYQQVNGIELYYEWHGNHNACPLVCINGLLADTTGWLFQLPSWQEQFRVLVYDCRGQGQSEKPAGPYLVEEHVQDLVSLLDALHIQQTHVVGVSNGGTIAVHFAALYPERVAYLVLSSTYAQTDRVIHAVLESWRRALDHGGLGLRFDVAVPWVWGPVFLTDSSHLLSTLREKAVQADADAVRALIDGALACDPSSVVVRVQSPTLVLVGEDDVLTPPRCARMLAGMLPQAELVMLPCAGHALPIERPTVFNALVHAFLLRDM